MLKARRTRIEAQAEEKTFSSSDVARIAEVSLRRLQW